MDLNTYNTWKSSLSIESRNGFSAHIKRADKNYFWFSREKLLSFLLNFWRFGLPLEVTQGRRSRHYQSWSPNSPMCSLGSVGFRSPIYSPLSRRWFDFFFRRRIWRTCRRRTERRQCRKSTRRLGTPAWRWKSTVWL